MFLDFTSLLDVIMLLLFFFIMYSHFDVTNAMADAEDAKAKAAAEVVAAEAQAQQEIDEARKSKVRYDTLYQENINLKEKLEHDIKIVNQVTSQEANEIVAFNSGNNLKILLLDLNGPSVPMTIRVVLNQSIIGECVVTEPEDDESYQADNFSAEKLASWMQDKELKPDSVIMCDFVFRSSDKRSSEACDSIKTILDSMHSIYGYEHFYYSETNLSIRSRANNGRQEERDEQYNDKDEKTEDTQSR